MHSETQIPNSIQAINNGDHDPKTLIPSSITIATNDNDNGLSVLNTEPDPVAVQPVLDNNPPDSYWVSDTKVSDWLDHHCTSIERKSSVKLVALSRNIDPGQNRCSQRSVSFDHKPNAAIIGFGKKPNHHGDGKSKQNDKLDTVRLFRNRSEPGRDYVLQVTEPRSPRVSCIGRVGSKRGRGRKTTGFWKSVKAAFVNRGQTGKEGKKVR